jgi:hyperosmotically inducible periplasmic protein
MRSHLISNFALASQLFAVSAGLYLAAPLAQAQTEPVSPLQRISKTDRDLTAKIRRAVVSDRSLSVEAHNIHISAQNGTVTLTGPVKSEAEKQAIEEKADQIAGTSNVTDALTVSGR